MNLNIDLYRKKMIWIRRNPNYIARIDIMGRIFNAKAYESYSIRKKGLKLFLKRGCNMKFLVFNSFYLFLYFVYI